MKAADLEKAAALARACDDSRRIRDRLASGETLTLLVGEGPGAAALVLTAGYAHGIRADLVAVFDARIADSALALRALGVEP